MKIDSQRKVGKPLGTIGVILSGWSILLVVLLMSGTGDCQPVSNKLELSRQDAVAMAIRKNIDLETESLNPVMAKATLAGSKGIYDPILNASTSTDEISSPVSDSSSELTSATVGVSQLIPTGATISASTQSSLFSIQSPSMRLLTRDWQSSAGVGIVQPLLKNFGKENTELVITLASNAYQGQLEQYRFFMTDLVLSVIKNYNQLYTLRKVQAQQDAALSSAIKFFDELKKNANKRELGKTEIANAEYAIYLRRESLVQASLDVKNKEADLCFLIGLKEKPQLIIPLDPPSGEEPAENEEQAVKTALEVRSDLKQYQLGLLSSELQERFARNQTLPDLAVELRGTLDGDSSPGAGRSFEQIGRSEAGSWFAGLQLSYPIGNRTARNNYFVSKLRTEQVKHQITSFSWQIQNSVELAMRALVSARLQIQLADKSLEIAKIRLEEYRKDLKEGTCTVQNVIDSETDLIGAEIGLVQAKETFSLAVAQLWREMGVLLDHNNIHIDSSSSEKVTEAAVPEASPKAAPPESTPSQSQTKNKGRADAVSPVRRQQAASLRGPRR